MEKQYYNCAICWARLLLEMKFQGNMLCFFFFFPCQTCWFQEVDIYVGIATIFWKTSDQLSPQMNAGWKWPPSEMGPELHLEFFLYSDKCHFCGRKGITKWVMILNIQIHSPVVSQSFHFVDQHNVKKILSGYCGSKYCLTVPFSFSPYIIFLLLTSETEGFWRLTGTKVQTHISWPVWVTMEIILVEMDQYTQAGFALVPSNTAPLAPNNTWYDCYFLALFTEQGHFSHFWEPSVLVLTVPHSLGDDKLPVTHSRTCSAQFYKASFRRSCSLPLGKGTSRWDQSRFLQWSTTLSKCKTPVKLKWRKWVCLSTEVQTYMTSGSQMFSIFQ